MATVIHPENRSAAQTRGAANKEIGQKAKNLPVEKFSIFRKVKKISEILSQKKSVNRQ